MPETEPEDNRATPSAGTPRKTLVRVPLYFWSIVLIFIIPVLGFLALLWKKVPKAPALCSFGLIGLIGWSWSWTVSYNGWWSFGEHYLLGLRVVPYLPVEEFLFYPFGGLLCILLYVWRRSAGKPADFANPKAYWAYLVVGTLAFGALAWATWSRGPYYITSQIVLYNIACSMLLAPWTADRIDLKALGVPIVLLGIAGFAWDYVGFKYGWWAFHAVVGIKLLGVVHIDDFDFFCFAPPAAISIYIVFCRLFGSPQVLGE